MTDTDPRPDDDAAGSPGEDLAPPPATATPDAEAGQPAGDVKPESEGDVDPQSSPENQELQSDTAAGDDGTPDAAGG